MDVSPYLSLKPAPAWLFDGLADKADRPRFMVASSDGWRPVRYGELADTVRAVALWLDAEGLAREGRVAVFAPNRVEWAAAAQAAQAAGGVLVPIYPSNTAAQAAYIVDHADAAFLFVDGQGLLEKVLERFGDYDRVRRIVLLDEALDVARAVAKLEAEGRPAPDPETLEARFVTWSKVVAVGAARHAAEPDRFEALLGAVELDQMGLMLYTSGTTGNPKGVPLTHRNFSSNHRDWFEVLGPAIPEHATDLLWLPMSHMFGYGETYIGNVLGWTSYLCAPQDALRLMPEVRPSAFLSVPAYWEKLAQVALQVEGGEARSAKLAESTGGNLEFCLSGGAGLKREVKELFLECGVVIIEGYGLTETSPTLTMNRPDAFRFDSVGKPFPSVELRLAEDGEILARGPNVFSGYHKDPVATQGAFTEDGWFCTGDVGRWTEDGYLQIVDRKKDILVTAGGKNVPPANIEMCFKDDPLIAHLVVFGDGHKYLVAGVWPAEPAEGDAAKAAQEAEIAARIEAVNRTLAKHETIKRFRIMDRPLTVEGGMLTPTLKVRRKKVYEAFSAELEALYA